MFPTQKPGLELLKSMNQQKVLQLIFTEGPISRVEIAQKTGLSQQTVTNIVNRLLEDQTVLEGDLQPLKAGSGRKRISLVYNHSNFYAIGVELASRSIRGCTYNFRQECLSSSERRTERFNSTDDLMSSLHEVIDELLQSVPVQCHVKGIGVSVQGLVNSKEGIILRTPRFNLQELHLKALLEQRYNIPIHINNDMNLLAYHASMTGNLMSSTNSITLKFDNGIGSALIADKHLISGATSSAGLFAHYKGFTGTNAHPCFCGGVGCLATLLSTSGFKKAMGLPLEEFSRLISKGDAEATALFDHIVHTASIAIANMASFLNPDSILLTGNYLTTLGNHHFVPKLTENVLKNVPETNRNIRFYHMETMPDAPLLAAGLVIKHEFELPAESF